MKNEGFLELLKYVLPGRQLLFEPVWNCANNFGFSAERFKSLERLFYVCQAVQVNKICIDLFVRQGWDQLLDVGRIGKVVHVDTLQSVELGGLIVLESMKERQRGILFQECGGLRVLCQHSRHNRIVDLALGNNFFFA